MDSSDNRVKSNNEVFNSDIVKEISKLSYQNQDIVQGIIQAYNMIIIRELSNGKSCALRNFMNIQVKYVTSGLVTKEGKSIEGGYRLYVTRSKLMSDALLSKTTIDIPTDIFQNSDAHTIKKLRKELGGVRTSCASLKKRLKDIDEKNKAKIAEVYRRVSEFRKVANAKKASRTAIKRRSENIVSQKIIRDRINSNYFLDAITSYPVLTKFYKSNGMSVNVLNMFIIINHFRYFEIKDAPMFGIAKTSAQRSLETLIANGLVELFKTKNNRYSVSLAGKKKFKQFVTETNKEMRTLLNSYKDKYEDSQDILPIKSKL